MIYARQLASSSRNHSQSLELQSPTERGLPGTAFLGWKNEDMEHLALSVAFIFVSVGMLSGTSHRKPSETIKILCCTARSPE